MSLDPGGHDAEQPQQPGQVLRRVVHPVGPDRPAPHALAPAAVVGLELVDLALQVGDRFEDLVEFVVAAAPGLGLPRVSFFFTGVDWTGAPMISSIAAWKEPAGAVELEGGH